MKRLVKDESLCIGCHNCEEACSKAFYKKEDLTKSLLHVKQEVRFGECEISVCTQCGICASVCNTGVIKQNKFGVWLVNQKECVGCYMCVGYCPEQVMLYEDGRNEPRKCIACGVCVRACPTGALRIEG